MTDVGRMGPKGVIVVLYDGTAPRAGGKKTLEGDARRIPAELKKSNEPIRWGLMFSR